MLISLKQASEILNLSENEVLFLHQNKQLLARVDNSTLAWVFDLEEVLTLKASLHK